jgi:hypothetical protein
MTAVMVGHRVAVQVVAVAVIRQLAQMVVQVAQLVVRAVQALRQVLAVHHYSMLVVAAVAGGQAQVVRAVHRLAAQAETLIR